MNEIIDTIIAWYKRTFPKTVATTRPPGSDLRLLVQPGGTTVSPFEQARARWDKKAKALARIEDMLAHDAKRDHRDPVKLDPQIRTRLEQAFETGKGKLEGIRKEMQDARETEVREQRLRELDDMIHEAEA